MILVQGLKYMRKNDEEFKKRSAKNKKNKVEGPKAKVAHSQGSITSTMWSKKLLTKSIIMNCLYYN